jgi:hypothetical protein
LSQQLAGEDFEAEFSKSSQSTTLYSMVQLGAQIVGFEIIAVFAVPLPASPTMQFSLTGRIGASLLSADLPRIRQKPFAANPAWPLTCVRFWHRALSSPWIDGTTL